MVELAAAAASSRRRLRSPGCFASAGVTAPIVGASKLSHLDEAIDALDLKLTPEESLFLEEPYQPHPVLGPL